MSEPALLAEAVALLRELAAGQREQTAELRLLRLTLERRPAPELVDALREFFGVGSVFTSAGVLMACDESPILADAVAAVVDMNAHPRSRVTSLGLLLASLRPEVERAGARRGAGLWRVRG